MVKAAAVAEYGLTHMYNVLDIMEFSGVVLQTEQTQFVRHPPSRRAYVASAIE